MLVNFSMKLAQGQVGLKRHRHSTSVYVADRYPRYKQGALLVLFVLVYQEADLYELTRIGGLVHLRAAEAK